LGRGALLCQGHEITIVALGAPVAAALKAARCLKEKGRLAGVISLRFIKPLDKELLIQQLSISKRLLTVEENSLAGGLWGAVTETLAAETSLGPYLLRGLGLSDHLPPQGSQSDQRQLLNLDADGIYKIATEMLDQKI
ncbi:MAG: transketolase C-terminal domain-containing protein, partial [Candidatus Adiutrix sp.]